MGSARLFTGMLVGAISSGALLSIAFYLIAVTDVSTSSPVGDVKDWKWVILAVGAFIGAVIGGAEGAIIVGSQLNLIKAVLVGCVLSLILSFVFLVLSGGPFQNHVVKYSIISIMTAGVVTGAIVSLIAVGGKAVP